MGLDGAYAQLDPLEPRAAPPPKRPTGAALFAGLSILFLLTFLLLLRLRLRPDATTTDTDIACENTCRIVLVESVPEGLELRPPAGPGTAQTWLELVATARHSLDIASFYWTLTNGDTRTHEPSALQPGHRLLLLDTDQRRHAHARAQRPPGRACPGGAAAAAGPRRGGARGGQRALAGGADGRPAGAGAQRGGRARRGSAAPHRRRAAHQVLAGGRRPSLPRQRQHGLEGPDAGGSCRRRKEPTGAGAEPHGRCQTQ
uniref:Uncharacterized protein n=1 Tax=Taeniopygia guttata TaxID=59729 RepID=A0A674HAU8_TAEGU